MAEARAAGQRGGYLRDAAGELMMFGDPALQQHPIWVMPPARAPHPVRIKRRRRKAPIAATRGAPRKASKRRSVAAPVSRFVIPAADPLMRDAQTIQLFQALAEGAALAAPSAPLCSYLHPSTPTLATARGRTPSPLTTSSAAPTLSKYALNSNSTPWWTRLSHLAGTSLIKTPGEWDRTTTPLKLFMVTLLLTHGDALAFTVNLHPELEAQAWTKGENASDWLYKRFCAALKAEFGAEAPPIAAVFERCVRNNRIHSHGIIKASPILTSWIEAAFLKAAGNPPHNPFSVPVVLKPLEDHVWASYLAKGLLKEHRVWQDHFPRSASDTMPIPGKSVCINRDLNKQAEDLYATVRGLVADYLRSK